MGGKLGGILGGLTIMAIGLFIPWTAPFTLTHNIGSVLVTGFGLVTTARAVAADGRQKAEGGPRLLASDSKPLP